MAPVTQYVFAEMRRISDHFTAGSHEWLPYSVIPTFPKLICKQQFLILFQKAATLFSFFLLENCRHHKEGGNHHGG